MIGSQMSKSLKNLRRSSLGSISTAQVRRCPEEFSFASDAMLDHKQHIEREIHMIENPEVSAVNIMIYETSANKEEAQSSGVSIVARKKHELYGE